MATSTSNTARVPSAFEKLPAEIIHQICLHQPDAIMSLRRTCQTLRSKADYSFRKCHFKEITICAHPKSIATLQEITMNDRLSSEIEVLHVDVGGRLIQYCAEDDGTLLEYGIIREALRAILPKLKNLKKIDTLSSVWWDPEGDDGHQMPGKILGRRGIGKFYKRRRYDAPPMYSRGDVLLCSFLHWDVLRAVDASPNHGLELGLGQRNFHLQAQVLMGGLTRVPCADLMLPRVTKLFVHSLDTNGGDEHDIAVETDGACIARDGTPSPEEMYTHFFEHFPNLTELLLNNWAGGFPTALPPKLRELTLEVFGRGTFDKIRDVLQLIRPLSLLENLGLEFRFGRTEEEIEACTRLLLHGLREVLPDSVTQVDVELNENICFEPCRDGCDGVYYDGYSSVYYSSSQPKVDLEQWLENLHMIKPPAGMEA